jgi:hypothetical protein
MADAPCRHHSWKEISHVKSSLFVARRLTLNGATRKRLWALYAKTLAIESIFRGIATVRRVIYAHHAALACNHGWPAARRLDFLFCSATRHARARAIEAILGRIAFVVGVVHA